MIKINHSEIFNIIDFLEQNIKLNIKNIHKKYLDKTQIKRKSWYFVLHNI